MSRSFYYASERDRLVIHGTSGHRRLRREHRSRREHRQHGGFFLFRRPGQEGSQALHHLQVPRKLDGARARPLPRGPPTIRSHAQKYFLKVQKNGTGEHVPPPRPKRKATHPYPQKAPKHDASATTRKSTTTLPCSWTYGCSQPVVGEHEQLFFVMPDFARVYGFLGSVFDPSTSGHLQKLRDMDPINVETVLLLMKNLAVNLISSDFEGHIPSSSAFKKAPASSRQETSWRAARREDAAEAAGPSVASTSSLVPEGSGAAAPTPGELFLEHHYAREAAALVLKQSDLKEKKKRRGKVVSSSSVACCYGCGAPLQTEEADAPGYVDSETFELKKRHRQLRTMLCGRCRMLSHGSMVTAVGGHGGYAGGKQFILAEELREKLSHIRHEKALIVKLVDIVDFNGSFLARIRDLAGANPIILVLTKVDLLPKGTDLNCVGDWVVEATMKKKLNVISIHLTSSKSLVGIAGVISEIRKEKKGRDIYILGAANVGKSAFINALLRTMAMKDPVAAAAHKYKPMQSAVPGTTLGTIQIEAFQGGGKLFDTPGVHLHHRQAAVVHSQDLPYLAPQSRLRAQSFPVVSNSKLSASDAVSLNGFSIFWGGLVRLDVLEALSSTRLSFFGPRKLPIVMVPTAEAEEFYNKEIGISLFPPSEKSREAWPGLRSPRQLKIKFDDKTRFASDIAISGLGWIAVEPFGLEADGTEARLCKGELRIDVHVPKPVEVFVRAPLPVGPAGGEWYQYRDLTDMEQELRPKWYY